MTFARSTQVDLSISPYYHCMTRCVRRTFLCGYDEDTGRDYSYRKPVIVARIKYLASVFAIHVCAYAVMSNHYHLVLFVNEEQSQAWKPDEVVERWSQLYLRDALSIKTLSKNEAEYKIAQWRSRLTDISWFMRALNESIARSSNKEEDKKGRFWEGRFKSQALLDEGALLSAMVYVDLNPIRAKIAETPETSDFTSIQDRLWQLSEQLQSKKVKENLKENINELAQPDHLMPLTTKHHQSSQQSRSEIDFNLSDYIQLVDYTGRIFHEGKRGTIPEDIAPILIRLQLNPKTWLDLVRNLQSSFSYAIGHQAVLLKFGRHYRCQAPKGLKVASNAYFIAA